MKNSTSIYISGLSTTPSSLHSWCRLPKNIFSTYHFKIAFGSICRTSLKFDGIYSNKVLHHLSPDQLVSSFRSQHAVLLPGGIALHSFWLGDGEEFMHGLRFRYYPEKRLHSLVKPFFTILESTRYTEFETEDSLYLVLKKE